MAKKIANTINKTYLCFILDKSGSMGIQTDRAISGFNEFLAEQKKVKGKASLSLTLFDTTVHNLYADVPLESASELTRITYQPSGYTALYDAIGTTIKTIENKIGPKDRVIVAIFTDGQENSSWEYYAGNVRKLITEKEAQGNWTFAFMGVDKDAWIVGGNLGIQQGNIAAINAKDVRQSTQYASRTIAAMRTTNAIQTNALYSPKLK